MVNSSLTDSIKAHEGCNLFPYTDSRGFPTIGWGRKLTLTQALQYQSGITQDQADQWLQQDIDNAVIQCNKAFPWIDSLDDDRQNVVAEMIFQLGLVGVMGFKTMLACLKYGDYAGASQAMLNSKWHSQTPARCEELASIMLNGCANP